MVQYHSDGMIKKILGNLVIVSIFLAMFLSNIEADREVTFPDKNLEEAIREEIEKSTGPIYESDLKEITELWAGSRNIKNIKGLEYCKNLKVLDLSRNYILDISPLSNLTNLKELSLEVNNISDISPLSDLTNLIYLYLSQNNISDISSLSNLTNLYILYLDYNPLNSESVNTYIPELEKRGVKVEWESTRETYRSPTTPPATTPSATTSVSAQFEIIDLRVIPENPRIGDTLNILVDVRNTGNSLDSYTVLVTIGEESMTKNIELEGKSSKTVSFHKVITKEKNIKIRAGDLTKTLTILPRETSPSSNKLRYFIVVIVAIVTFLVMYFLDKKSKEIILSKIRLIAQKKRVIGALIISIIVVGGVYFFWPMFVDRSSESFEFKTLSGDTMSTALPIPTEFPPTTSTPSYTPPSSYTIPSPSHTTTSPYTTTPAPTSPYTYSPSPPKKAVDFNIMVLSMEECGWKCRKIQVALINTGDYDAHNVRVIAVFYSDGELIKMSGQKYLERYLGTIPAHGRKTETIELECGYWDTTKIKRKGIEIILRIESSEKIKRFEGKYYP
ncbi:MAG TPA: hypothetical protein ENI52_00830 [Thermoplasmata archaeon]|nr:hypothetical protein [Thermoplasmata archaeon]